MVYFFDNFVVERMIGTIAHGYVKSIPVLAGAGALAFGGVDFALMISGEKNRLFDKQPTPASVFGSAIFGATFAVLWPISCPVALYLTLTN